MSHSEGQLHFTEHLPGESVSAASPSVSTSTCYAKELLDINGTDLYGQMSFLFAYQKCQSTEPNQWPGLNLSSSTTGLPEEKDIAPYTSSDASTSTSVKMAAK